MSNIGEVKFKIFKKRNGYYWTNTSIVYAISFGCLFVYFFKLIVLNIEDSGIFDKILFYGVIGAMAYGIIMGVSGFVRYQPLKGKIEGELILERDKITFDNKIYHLNEISQIKILNYDFYGRFKPPGRGSFEASLSRGVGNEIEIKLFNGETIKNSFYQFNRNDISVAKKHLFYYYLNQKIMFFDLAKILDKSSDWQIEILKRELNLFREELVQEKIL